MKESMTEKDNSREIKFDLIDNGIDFIINAIRLISSKKESSDYKYAVLSLYSGVEILLKIPLQNIHWSLVVKDINKTDYSNYKIGDFQSVNLDECIQRLKNVCDIQIDKESCKAINVLREKRNRIEHFGILDTEDAIIASIIPILDFVLNFLSKDVIGKELSKSSIDKINDIRREAGEFKEYVDQKISVIKLPKDTSIIKCPICLQDTLVIDDGGKCLFCNYHASAEEIAELYISDVIGFGWHDYKSGENPPLYICPSCGLECFFPMNDEKFEYVCSSCGEKYIIEDIEFCCDCGEPFIKDGSPYCPDCYQARMMKE
ncbi:MAG: hypothetical protein GYA51_06070 [Candidatus Methanofastidiosa archaeon]|nr:hypothetical protein [Candidatus Methanofastidiosa archaeon]